MSFTMNGLDRILKACSIIGIDSIKTLFIAGEINRDYLVFATDIEQDDYLEHESLLKELGITYLGKFEALAIERELLWDIRNS